MIHRTQPSQYSLHWDLWSSLSLLVGTFYLGTRGHVFIWFGLLLLALTSSSILSFGTIMQLIGLPFGATYVSVINDFPNIKAHKQTSYSPDHWDGRRNSCCLAVYQSTSLQDCNRAYYDGHACSCRSLWGLVISISYNWLALFQKRRAVIEDLSIGLGIPFLQMGLRGCSHSFNFYCLLIGLFRVHRWGSSFWYLWKHRLLSRDV